MFATSLATGGTVWTMNRSVLDDIVALVLPDPDSGEFDDGDAYQSARERNEAHRAEMLGELRLRCDSAGEGYDPLLNEIVTSSALASMANARTRRLVAYAREVAQPRYELGDLAAAAGMSVSGIRTFYRPADVLLARQLTGRALRTSGNLSPDDRELRAAALRASAKGLYATEAATELLVRALSGRFTADAWPWVQVDDEDPSWVSIDWAAIEPNIGALSGGEQRMLRLAAAIAGGARIDLADAVTGLDRYNLTLVLAALSHAAGSHEHSEYLPAVLDDGRRLVTPDSPRIDYGPLVAWPAEEA
jgi:hypothetical protein